MLSSWIIHESPTQGRESGSLQYYSLPGVSLDGSVLHSSKPEHLAFNCTSTYVTSTHTLRALLHITLCSLSLSRVCKTLHCFAYTQTMRCEVLSLSLSLSLSCVCKTLRCFAYTNKQTKRCEVLSLSLSLSGSFLWLTTWGFWTYTNWYVWLVGTFWKEGINPPSVDIMLLQDLPSCWYKCRTLIQCCSLWSNSYVHALCLSQDVHSGVEAAVVATQLELQRKDVWHLVWAEVKFFGPEKILPSVLQCWVCVCFIFRITQICLQWWRRQECTSSEEWNQRYFHAPFPELHSSCFSHI